MKLGLFIAAFLMYLGNYHLCNLLSGDNIDSWYKLRGVNYTAIFALLFAAANIDAKGALRFILNVAFSITMSDLIDRLFFDITTYEWKDLLTLTITLLTSFCAWKYKNN